MADEPMDQVIDNGAEPVEEPSESPEQTTEEPVEEADSPDQAQVDETAPEVKSERGKKRVDQLARERTEAVAENKKLKELLSQEESKADKPQQVLPPWLEQKPQGFNDLAGQELTPEMYDQHLTARAEQIADLKVEQLKREMAFRESLNNDMDYLEKSYPELQGEISDPALSKALQIANSNYKVALKANPQARLRDFIEPLMLVRQGAVQAGKSEASVKLAEQASQGALRSSQPTQTVSTEAEIERMLESGEISAEEAMRKFPDIFN